MSSQEQPEISPGAVLIADDHEVTRFGLGQLVRNELGASRVIEADRFETALERIGDQDVGLAIVDLGMPGLGGPEALADLRRERPDVKLVILSGSARREDILGCVAAGAHGYIIKTQGLEQLVDRLQHVLRGEIYLPPSVSELGESPGPGAATPRTAAPVADSLARLTPGQVKVLRCLERGLTNKEIARELSISDRTVKMHLSSIYPLLGVHNRTQAAAIARELPALTDTAASSDEASGAAG